MDSKYKNIYVGNRYVPKPDGVWDKEKNYESLSIVLWEGSSYTSKKNVPAGIDINNEEYWSLTGNYNAQVENYRRDVKDMEQRVNTEMEDTTSNVETKLNETTDYVDNELNSVNQQLAQNVQQREEDVSRLNQKIDDNINSVNQQLAQTTSNVETKLEDTTEYVESKLNKTTDNVSNEINLVNQQLDEFENYVKYPFSENVNESLAKKTFIDAMNDKAKDIGMFNTKFMNPHGLPHEEQITTAKDMLLMGLHASAYKDISHTWGTKERTIEILGKNNRNLDLVSTVLKSTIDNNYQLMGGKTGTLTSNGQNTMNLFSIVNSKDTTKSYAGVVLDANESRYTSTRLMYDNATRALANGQKASFAETLLQNGNFSEGLDTWDILSGDPSISDVYWYSAPHSLNVTSNGTSSQIGKTVNFLGGQKYFISCMCNCIDYTQGAIGLQTRINGNIIEGSISRTTDGFERASIYFETNEEQSHTLYVGAMHNANLDGYVDNVIVVNLTSAFGKGNEPTESEANNLLYNDIDAKMGAAVLLNGINPATYTERNFNPIGSVRSLEQGYPASLTKIMTCMITLDYLKDLNTIIEVEESDITRGSGPSLQAGDKIKLRDCLYLLLLESSNTIATTLSRLVGSNIVKNKRKNELIN